MEEINLNEINTPIDLVHQSLGKKVYVKCRGNRELKGKLHAYDVHLNLMLSDVEEVYNKEIKRNMDLIYLRGDLVILVSPLIEAK
jgi:U6 snRNA-associated Sm-like protein LSm3